MSKLSLCLTSLVAAIPGGILAALMVMTIVSGFNKMPTSVTVLAGIVLAISAFVTVLPLGILLFGPRAPGEPEEKGEELAAVTADEADESAVAGAGDFGDEEFATAEIETEEGFAEEEFEEWEEEKK
ncbi:MAG: hypothetical protein WD066_07955 [Planctomycetaceae bacterium]